MDSLPIRGIGVMSDVVTGAVTHLNSSLPMETYKMKCTVILT